MGMIQVGSVVVLNSYYINKKGKENSPRMTVIDVENDEAVQCMWYDDHKFHLRIFDIKILTCI